MSDEEAIYSNHIPVPDIIKDIGYKFSLDEYNTKYICYQINNWFNDLYSYSLPRFQSNCDLDSLNITVSQKNLCKLFKKDVCVWLSTTGELKYRLTINGDIKTTTFAKASIILTAYCKIDLKFTKNSNNNPEDISIYDLLIIEDEKFDPFQPKEFFTLEVPDKSPILGFNNIQHNRDIFYINSFKPSYYHYLSINEEDEPKLNIKTSIILQYIHYLANYDQSRFTYILGWLASFFQDFKNKSKMILILVGNENSGIELLFNNIIMPLFGESNTVKISDYNLDIKNQSLLIKNKLFYNLHNLSSRAMNNKKNIAFIDNILLDNVMNVEINQQKIINLPLYGQVLITTKEEPSYISSSKHHKYKIFKVTNNINSIYLNNVLKKQKSNSSLDDMIKTDLVNFSKLLRFYSPHSYQDVKDDKDTFKLNIDDILTSFHNTIINCSDQSLNILDLDKEEKKLYLDLKKDFENKQIKQKNIFKFFILLYPNTEISSSRTLMKKLRKLDSTFYDRKALKNGAHGLKYFIID